MSEERQTWVEESAKLRQRQLDECPEELRPYMQRVQVETRAFMAALPWPNRIRAAISDVEERVAAISDARERATLLSDLEDLDQRLIGSERELNSAKEAANAASEAYQEALLEWRTRQVPETRRDEARALLHEERSRIAALYEGSVVTGDVYGAAAMEIVRLSALLSDARRTGDRDAAAHWESESAEARATFEKLQSPIEAHKQAQQDLKDEYERRLRALIDYPTGP